MIINTHSTGPDQVNDIIYGTNYLVNPSNIKSNFSKIIEKLTRKDALMKVLDKPTLLSTTTPYDFGAGDIKEQFKKDDHENAITTSTSTGTDYIKIIKTIKSLIYFLFHKIAHKLNEDIEAVSNASYFAEYKKKFAYNDNTKLFNSKLKIIVDEFLIDDDIDSAKDEGKTIFFINDCTQPDFAKDLTTTGYYTKKQDTKKLLENDKQYVDESFYRILDETISALINIQKDKLIQSDATKTMTNILKISAERFLEKYNLVGNVDIEVEGKIDMTTQELDKDNDKYLKLKHNSNNDLKKFDDDNKLFTKIADLLFISSNKSYMLGLGSAMGDSDIRGQDRNKFFPGDDVVQPDGWGNTGALKSYIKATGKGVVRAATGAVAVGRGAATGAVAVGRGAATGAAAVGRGAVRGLEVLENVETNVVAKAEKVGAKAIAAARPSAWWAKKGGGGDGGGEGGCGLGGGSINDSISNVENTYYMIGGLKLDINPKFRRGYSTKARSRNYADDPVAVDNFTMYFLEITFGLQLLLNKLFSGHDISQILTDFFSLYVKKLYTVLRPNISANTKLPIIVSNYSIYEITRKIIFSCFEKFIKEKILNSDTSASADSSELDLSKDMILVKLSFSLPQLVEFFVESFTNLDNLDNNILKPGSNNALINYYNLKLGNVFNTSVEKKENFALISDELTKIFKITDEDKKETNHLKFYREKIHKIDKIIDGHEDETFGLLIEQIQKIIPGFTITENGLFFKSTEFAGLKLTIQKSELEIRQAELEKELDEITTKLTHADDTDAATNAVAGGTGDGAGAGAEP